MMRCFLSVDPAAGDAFGGDSAAKCASETAGAGAGAGAAVGAAVGAVDDRVTTGIEGHWLNDKPGASSEKSKTECALAPAVGAWGGGRGGCGAGFGPKWWKKRGVKRGIRQVGRTSARSSVGVCSHFGTWPGGMRDETAAQVHETPNEVPVHRPFASSEFCLFGAISEQGAPSPLVGAPA